MSNNLYKDCETCEHSEELDGSNCYECVKKIANNFETQPCDECADGEGPNTPEVNLYEVELMLRRLIERDQDDPYIKKPIAHALYLTWKWADEYERSKDDGRRE